MALHQVCVSPPTIQRSNRAKRNSSGYHEFAVSMCSSAGTTWAAWHSSGIPYGISCINVGHCIHSSSTSVAKCIIHRALFGTPISGQLVGSYGYLALSMYAGTSLVVGALLIFWARLKLSKSLFSRQWSCWRPNSMLWVLYVFDCVSQEPNDVRDVAGSFSFSGFIFSIDIKARRKPKKRKNSVRAMKNSYDPVHMFWGIVLKCGF